MNKEKLLNLLKIIEKKEKGIELLRREKEVVLSEILEIACPFKIGDIVTICGYSYQGKNLKIDGRCMEKGWWNYYIWRVMGTVLKKDGSLSKMRAYFNERDYNYMKEGEEKK